MEKRRFMVMFVIIFLLFSIYVTHATPTIAIRTLLFSKGYFNQSIYSKIVLKDQNKGLSLYEVILAPVEKQTNGELATFKIKREFFFYSAEYYGEG